MVDGVAGGRSTYGVCFGLLAWRIVDGDVSGVDVSGLNTALAVSYDDDEPGSPWTVKLHVDVRGDGEQRRALEYVFLDGLPLLPWIRKERHLLGVEASEITFKGTHVTVGTKATMRATQRVETDQRVACVIPGYDREGYELYADELHVWDHTLSGNCAYASDFDYRS